ncbi:MAG: hypothetical protein ACLGHO_09555 [Gammaproteobacteria bacterium]
MPRNSGDTIHRRPGRSRMDVPTTIPSGQPGTQRFQRKYGERLVLVRYRHDAARQRRLTTVELIVDEAPFQPRRPLDRELFPNGNRIVHVRVAYGESDLRQKVKEAGAQWDAEKKLWKMRLVKAVRLGLKDRIQER